MFFCLDKIAVLLEDNTGQVTDPELLRERALKRPKFVSIDPQLASTLALRSLLRVQERPQRMLLRRVERPAMHRHIRMQQSANADVIHYGQECGSINRTSRASPRDLHRTSRPPPRLVHAASAPSAPARSSAVARARAKPAALQVRCPPRAGPPIAPRANWGGRRAPRQSCPRVSSAAGAY